MTFEAECSPVRWFYHTARTQANFYESCQLRDALLAFAEQQERGSDAIEKHRQMFERWKQVLLDEKANTETAPPSGGTRYAAGLLLRHRPCISRTPRT